MANPPFVDDFPTKIPYADSTSTLGPQGPRVPECARKGDFPWIFFLGCAIVPKSAQKTMLFDEMMRDYGILFASMTSIGTSTLLYGNQLYIFESKR